MEKKLPETAKPVFYLDWNIISYLNDPSCLKHHQKISLLCLKEILNQITRSSMIVPYSYVHFSDIRQGPRIYHKTWVSYLESTSDRWKVAELPENRDKVALYKIESVFNDFLEYNSDQHSFESRSPIFDNIASKAFEPVNTEILRQIKKYENNPNAKILNQVVDLFSSENIIDGLQILKFNKTLRNNLRDMNDIKIRYPEAKRFIKGNQTRPFKQLVDESILKSDLPWKSFEELEKATPIISTAGFLSPFMEKVNNLSMFAIMLGIGIDKLKKETAFKSLVNDMGHISLGLRCHYFVTEDSALIEKAVFIKNMMELPVVILGAEGLNRLLLTQMASYYKKQKISSGCDNESEVTFRFNDENGKEIRTYIINTDDSLL